MSLITAVSGAPFARMLGVGSYSPTRVVTNAEMCERIDSTDEWIRERSGITERRFAASDETVADMAVAAASKALASAGITADQVDCVIVASVTHLKATPSAAAEMPTSKPRPGMVNCRPRPTSRPRPTRGSAPSWTA